MVRMPRDTDIVQRPDAEFETVVRELGHWMDKALEFTDNRYGIGIVERSCLEFLAASSDGRRPDEIGEYLRLSVGETSALVSRLERRGFARRERDPSDPDIVTVHAALENNVVMAIVHARRALLNGVQQNFDAHELAIIARYASYLMSVHPARLAENAERLAARTSLG